MSRAYITSLSIYPLKSCAPVQKDSIKVLKTGLSGDRRFMLTKLDGQMVTGRTHPMITQIQCVFEKNQLILRHPSCEEILIDLLALASDYYQTEVWGTRFSAQGCGDKANQWVSSLLGEPVRILFFGEKSNRLVKGYVDESVGFADGFPLLLTNDASLEHLNQRLIAPVSMTNFRPNITFSGMPAWSEDEWQSIRIGEVVFDLVQPCGRCIFTTVDPKTANLDPAKEPFKTLTSYRKEEEGNDVIFGENMIALNEGVIKVGDEIEVISRKSRPFYVDNWAIENRRTNQHLAITSGDVQNNAELILRCINIVNETDDVKTFVFSQDPVTRFSYYPGQFITISLNINDQVINRCYTISSSPSKPDTISITVKRVANGLVSNWLHNNFSIGSSIKASNPSGIFHLNEKTSNDILLISAGSGVTPMLSIVRYISDLSLGINVHFHHSAKTEADLIALDELNVICKNKLSISHSYNFTRQNENALSLTLNSTAERLSSAVLSQFCSDYLKRDVFVCGPEGFMEKAKTFLLASGLQESQYHQESFVIEQTGIDEDYLGESYNVNFLASGIEVKVFGDQTILEAAEAVGIYPNYSCLSGVCGSCTSELVSGTVHAPDALAIDVNDPDSNDFLPCCSYARSDLEVEL